VGAAGARAGAAAGGGAGAGGGSPAAPCWTDPGVVKAAAKPNAAAGAPLGPRSDAACARLLPLPAAAFRAVGRTELTAGGLESRAAGSPGAPGLCGAVGLIGTGAVAVSSAEVTGGTSGRSRGVEGAEASKGAAGA